MICIKQRKKYGYLTASDVGMSGFLAILRKNPVCALTPSVIAHTGKNQENEKDSTNKIYNNFGKIYNNTLPCF